MRDPAGVTALLSAIDPLDLLVNNAGGQFVAPAETISRRGFAGVLDLNLTAVARLIELVAPPMPAGARSSPCRCPRPTAASRPSPTPRPRGRRSRG